MDATVSGLWTYPVKGCRGIPLEASPVAVEGLRHDRQWMIVDRTGRFVTQREFPRMCQIGTRIADESLQLDSPDGPPLSVALGANGPRAAVTVWRDSVSAIDAGDDAANWISGVLGSDLRLVRFDPAGERPCNPAWAGDSGAHTRFADGYPVLVIGEASLADLNSRLRAPLPMDRFRPNLTLAGIGAFEEDHIDRLDFGAVELQLVKPCTRCQVTTTDQETGQVGAEPLTTLGRYRMNPDLGGVTFGMNAVVRRCSDRPIRVGDAGTITFRF